MYVHLVSMYNLRSEKRRLQHQSIHTLSKLRTAGQGLEPGKKLSEAIVLYVPFR